MTKISVAKAKKLIEKGGKIFDVRSPVEFARKSIPGSINLTLRNVSHLPKYVKKDNAVILVGDTETKKDLEMMERYAGQLGFLSVFLLDGIESWSSTPENNHIVKK